MEIKIQLIALAALIPFLAISSFPDAKAGESLFVFYVDRVKWDLKIDTSGSNAGMLFLRKNKRSTKCKQYVFNVDSAKAFLTCASKKIGRKYIKQYIVNPIDKEIPGSKKYIMAAYRLI